MAWILAGPISDTKPLKIYFQGALLNSNQWQRDLRNEIFARCSWLDSAFYLLGNCLWLFALGTHSAELINFVGRRLHSCSNRRAVAAQAAPHSIRESTNHRSDLCIDFPGIRSPRFPAADLDGRWHH